MPVKCPKCRFENPEEAVYCSKCATRLEEDTKEAKATGENGARKTGTGGTGKASSPDIGRGKVPFSVTRTLETKPEGLGKGELFAGRFELIEELGAGGMGAVYRAYDKEVGEEIALKVLHPDIALDERTVDRFRNEIKLARRITHKNVCRMH